MKKTILNILSYIMILIGSIYIISYLNLLNIGFTFTEYIIFIIKKIECIILIMGILILIIINKGEKK